MKTPELKNVKEAFDDCLESKFKFRVESKLRKRKTDIFQIDSETRQIIFNYKYSAFIYGHYKTEKEIIETLKELLEKQIFIQTANITLRQKQSVGMYSNLDFILEIEIHQKTKKPLNKFKFISHI